MRAAVLVLFLVPRLLSAFDLFHHDADDEAKTPTLCPTCTEESPCPPDRSHHHHANAHAHGLCPSCVQAFAHLPLESARAPDPDGILIVDRPTLAPTPGQVPLSTHSSRAPPDASK